MNNQPDALDRRAILNGLGRVTREMIADFEVLTETDSTSSYLMRQGAPRERGARVCLAETQSAGRGRHGKRWVSPRGANLYVSLSCRFTQDAIAAVRLSLLIAVAIADALTALGARGVALKWPNDIVWRGRKLGGILLEMAGGANGSYIVVGIGVNIDMSDHGDIRIDQLWTDLATVMPGTIPLRNLLAARILDAVVTTIRTFNRERGKSLENAWRRYDFTYGQVAEVQAHDARQRGRALGVDADGRLVMEINGQRRTFTCGDVSLITSSQRVVA